MRSDAVVIGAGFYGCSIALHLKALGFHNVVLVEAGSAIMTRASFANQARVHSGYHYPRSLQTGKASRESFPRFAQEYAFALRAGLKTIYAIARSSRVTPAQFERFCSEIAAPLDGLPKDLARKRQAEAVQAW